MKIINTRKVIITVALSFLGGSAFAYTPDKPEEICKKPKFTDFSVSEYKESTKIEIQPESSFFFKLSAWTDPATIKLTAKGKEIPFQLESTSTFHKITVKLLPDMTGQFVRLNASAKAALGCDQQQGWLLKVANK